MQCFESVREAMLAEFGVGHFLAPVGVVVLAPRFPEGRQRQTDGANDDRGDHKHCAETEKDKFKYVHFFKISKVALIKILS